eukprot:gnl/TRDRNA2_/TRDRNA2_181762_c0_seq1.p1 gnl/TRDRNA2_/TRDRNA2_181762_c0~~gnl/TRDRNA2_/TRDRNA2_181762_c0_seq1.p1  ORF type:complete len:213 (-),score=52.84 gnl/TRDRNA2_/TRDRNA2_181762_c0_seq1:106-651(-)
MSIVTGGLGGLGILSCSELAAAGCNMITTTSRSGRPGSMRPELLQVMERMQHSCVHYMVRCDVSDGSACVDMFGMFSRPAGEVMGENNMHLDDMVAGLKKPGAKVDADTVKALYQIKMQLSEIIVDFRKRMTDSDEDKKALEEMEQRDEEVSKFIFDQERKLGIDASQSLGQSIKDLNVRF